MRKLFYIALIFMLTVPALASADSFGPTLSILTPNNNAVVNKPSILILIQAWDADAAPSTPQVNKDGGGFAVDAGVVEDINRSCGTNCKVFKYTWDLSSYSNDTTHTIQFRSSDGTNTSDSKIITITVKDTRTGDGYLLSRGGSSQVCIDCHNVVSHSSQATDTGYGNWAILCTDCHTPHNTTNIMLIKETITTPNSGNKPVALWNRSGDAVNSFVDSTASGVNIKGVCQVCHTQTTGSGTSRWRNTGNGESPAHYGAPGTQKCTDCHGHIGGFKASCDSCHGNPPTTATIGGTTGLATPATGATSPLSPGAHVKHTAAPRSMLCNTCHTGGMPASTIPSNTIHIGFTINSTNVPGFVGSSTGGTLDAYLSLNAPYTGWVAAAGTTVNLVGGYTTNCSSLYCHGSTLTAGTLTNPSWVGGASQTTCGTCHGGSGYAVSTATPPTTGKHTTHASTTTGNLGLACNKCHNSTSDMGHVNGNVAWSLDTADSRIGLSATYKTSASGTTGGLAPSATYGNCETLYCHSNGKVGTTVENYTTVTWDGSNISCNGCHGKTTSAGTPDYTNAGAGTVAANSHQKHTASGTSTCVYCHSTTTTTGTTITGTVHIDNTRDVMNGGGKTFSYAPQTCSTISCHGNNNAIWGGTVSCSDCHTYAGSGETDDYSYDNGITASINSTEWTTRGHGQTTAVLPLTCAHCHDGGGVAHGVSTNPFRLANNNALGNGLNDTCNICHKTGASGYSGKNSTVKVDKYHYGSNHDATRNGGQFCWDCHDPHGDSSNIKMIHSKPAKKSNTYGVPTETPTNPVVFTNNTIATGAGGFAMTSGTFENGICNTCHTYSASAPTVVYYTSTSSTSHNSGTVCTQCHKHSADTTYNNEAFKGGGCNGCHDYDTTAGAWGSGTHQDAPINEGWGAHAKHIDHIKARFGGLILNPTADTFGTGAAAQVCGACHTNASVEHSTSGGGARSINFGDGRYKEGSTDGTDGFSFLFDPAATSGLPATLPRPQYNGVSGTSSSVNPKSCSAVGCHFKTTPVWQTY